MNTWRFIESRPADIFAHMALDRELFEEFIQDPGACPVLRVYKVSEPGITVGRSSAKRGQTPFRGLTPFCVRPTGGGWVQHGNDLIYSVIARRNTFSTFQLVRTSYLSFHEAIQEALTRLGIETRLFRCDEAEALEKKRSRSPKWSECFKAPVATDLLFQEEKIAGGGQWRKREGFLHQGSIRLLAGLPFDGLKETLKEAFRLKFDIVWDDSLLPVGTQR